MNVLAYAGAANALEFEKVDLLVKARLRLPLRAYTGLGNFAQGKPGGPDKGTKWVPTQHQKVRQLYIPGLLVHGRQQQLWETVFDDLKVTELK